MKTRVNTYKVNVFNKTYKEVWAYTTSLNKAQALCEKANKNGLGSSVYEWINGKWTFIGRFL